MPVNFADEKRTRDWDECKKRFRMQEVRGKYIKGGGQGVMEVCVIMLGEGQEIEQRNLFSI